MWICTECESVCGLESRAWMPEEVKRAGIGEQMVWLATQPATNLTCLNEKCSNYLA